MNTIDYYINALHEMHPDFCNVYDSPIEKIRKLIIPMTIAPPITNNSIVILFDTINSLSNIDNIPFISNLNISTIGDIYFNNLANLYSEELNDYFVYIAKKSIMSMIIILKNICICKKTMIFQNGYDVVIYDINMFCLKQAHSLDDYIMLYNNIYKLFIHLNDE